MPLAPDDRPPIEFRITQFWQDKIGPIEFGVELAAHGPDDVVLAVLNSIPATGVEITQAEYLTLAPLPYTVTSATWLDTILGII